MVLAFSFLPCSILFDPCFSRWSTKSHFFWHLERYFRAMNWKKCQSSFNSFFTESTDKVNQIGSNNYLFVFFLKSLRKVFNCYLRQCRGAWILKSNTVYVNFLEKVLFAQNCGKISTIIWHKRLFRLRKVYVNLNWRHNIIQYFFPLNNSIYSYKLFFYVCSLSFMCSTSQLTFDLFKVNNRNSR